MIMQKVIKADVETEKAPQGGTTVPLPLLPRKSSERNSRSAICSVQ